MSYRNLSQSNSKKGSDKKPSPLNYERVLRKKYELSLRETEEKNKKLLDLLPDSVFIHKYGVITFMNSCGLSLLKATSFKQILGKNIKDFLTPDYHSLTDERIATMYSQKKSAPPIQRKIIALDKTLIDVEVTSNVLNLCHNSIITVVRDLSERKNSIQKYKLLEEKLHYDNLKTEFFTNISHEFKTPLNVILSAVQMQDLLLAQDKNINQNILKYSKMIKQNSYRLIRLVNNIIDTSKIDSGYLSLHKINCDIVKLIEDITLSVVDYVEQKNLNLVFDTNIEEKTISCDPDKIERVMLNLLSNAVKFTDANGSIFVTIMDSNDDLTISIKDTGIGISKELQNTIFKRFIQVDESLYRNTQGSGIGLSLVESLIHLHGGSVSLESKEGYGCNFFITFPQDSIKATENICEEKTEQNASNSKIETIHIEFSDIY
ncbi:PAS domain-containing sensor histidine kinase [Clostridium grantii]|uniref:histidine kinase n=1 Tax=Clostridium grantii DSM 8605 TaxID=1121316 RepID=A0A1M5XCF1_9CLOT|nr:PAS domain-containing sensor histidine kinase [Clostridium grantii]SHH97456.1 Signal transduction histidine kinase [Clostridium grantii DSM 8605]